MISLLCWCTTRTQKMPRRVSMLPLATFLILSVCIIGNSFPVLFSRRMLTRLPSLARHARFGSLLRALVIYGMQTDRCSTALFSDHFRAHNNFPKRMSIPRYASPKYHPCLLKPLVSSIYPRIMALQTRILHHRIPIITSVWPLLPSWVPSRDLRASSTAPFLHHPVPLGSSMPSTQNIRKTTRRILGEFSSLTRRSRSTVILGANLVLETAIP